MGRSARIQLAVVLVVIGVLVAIVGIIYLTQTTNHLPGFIPGKPSARLLKLPFCNGAKASKTFHCFTARKYTKRGIAALVVAAAALGGAWYVAGRRTSRERSHSAAA